VGWVVFGDVWRYLEVFGGVWQCLEVFASVWRCLALSLAFGGTEVYSARLVKVYSFSQLHERYSARPVKVYSFSQVVGLFRLQELS